MKEGYTGISFPFRIGNKGGVVMSTTSPTDISHIKESIQQIILTIVGERLMNPNFGSQLSTGLFFSEDEGIFGLLRFEIKQALDIFEPRIEINENDILIEGTDEGQIIVTLYFKVTKYQGNVFSTKVQM